MRVSTTRTITTFAMGCTMTPKKYMFSDNPIKKEQEKSVIFGSRLKSRQLDSIVVKK